MEAAKTQPTNSHPYHLERPLAQTPLLETCLEMQDQDDLDSEQQQKYQT
jgi:hypothetical protein